jgi:hypothetical protein
MAKCVDASQGKSGMPGIVFGLEEKPTDVVSLSRCKCKNFVSLKMWYIIRVRRRFDAIS